MRKGQVARATAAVMILVAWVSGPSRAVEPAREFLDVLRQRGYFDQALAYLEQMKTSPLAPDSFREAIGLEKGSTLIEASRVQRDAAVREKLLDDAQQLIQQFIDQQSGHAQVNTARSQLGNLVVERARMRAELAKRGGQAGDLADARKQYEAAFRLVVNQRDQIRVQLDQFPKFLDDKDAQQRQLSEQRDQLRTDYLQTLLMAAAIREEMADIVTAGSQEAKLYLTEAASLYESIYQDYRTRIAGLYARMYQARCLLKLKRHRDALGHLRELLDQPDAPDAFRTLKTKVLRYAMECWLDPSEKKHVEAIRRGLEWIAQSRPADDRDPEWLVLRLYLAKAYWMQAEETRQSSPGDKLIQVSLAESRKMATLVARSSSEFQADAQALLAQLGVPDRSGGKRATRTFADALEFGREAIEAVEAASLMMREMPARVATESDASAKLALEKQLAEARQSHATSQREALDQLRLALRLANRETPLNDLNLVRYFLAYLYFTQDNLHEAAVTGEIVARRYPDHSAARQCAKIALASYLKLYAENKDPDKDFETRHVVQVSEYIAATWPEQPEAEEALSTLVPFMINAGELDRAMGFLSRIPETSPRRGDAELKTGQAVWAQYLKGTQEFAKAEQEGAVTESADRVKLADLKDRALAILAAGYGRVQQRGAPDRATSLALLSLAQIYVDSQQSLQAVEVLENSRLGPLTLVRQGHPAAAEPGIVEETYRTALRAYMGALAVAPDQSTILDRAQQTMTHLKTAIASAPGGQERMVAVFISLARGLEGQLQVATPAAKSALSRGFESFLQQIREESTEFSVLNWVAETYLSLAAGLENGNQSSPDSIRLYQESRATFEKILATTPPEAKSMAQVQVRLAAVSRKERDFKSAVDTYLEVLADNPMLVNVQVEAARAYQEWAAVPANEQHYEHASNGNSPGKDGKNIIWGWGRIAQVTASYPQYRDTFHEANVNLGWCRVLFAEKQQGTSRDTLLRTALNSLVVVRRLYPELGGAARRKQYDAVVRRIQQAMGQTPVGLQAIAERPSSNPASGGTKTIGPPAAGKAQ